MTFSLFHSCGSEILLWHDCTARSRDKLSSETVGLLALVMQHPIRGHMHLLNLNSSLKQL